MLTDILSCGRRKVDVKQVVVNRSVNDGVRIKWMSRVRKERVNIILHGGTVTLYTGAECGTVGYILRELWRN